MRFEKLTQAIAAGGAWRLGLAAAELQIVASSYPLRVTLFRGGAVIGSGSNVLAGDYFRGVEFDFVELYSDDAQYVTLLLTDGESGSKRIVGEVSVINGELSRVKANKAFMRPQGFSAVAGEYPHMMLYNPAGSGKLVVATKVTVHSLGGNTVVSLVDHAAPLANTSGAGYSKMLGGAAGSGVIQYERGAVEIGVGHLMIVSCVAGVSNLFEFAEPFILGEGRGLLLRGWTAGVEIGASFQWFEVEI